MSTSGTKGLDPTVGFNIPYFSSTGGITPEQQGLADFTYGQDLMGQANLYGTSGTGQSTMATQGAEGAATQKAQQMGQMSDVNTGALYGQYQNNLSNFEQSLSNVSQLDQLAQSLGGSGAEINPVGGAPLSAYTTPQSSLAGA